MAKELIYVRMAHNYQSRCLKMETIFHERIEKHHEIVEKPIPGLTEKNLELWVGIDQAESACMFHEAALSYVVSAFFVVAEASLLDLDRYQFEIAVKRFMHDLTQNQFRSCAEFHLKEINKINELRRVAFSFS